MARLDSWKAIADYLGRDVRTVRRWEGDRGLPVHRVPGEHRGGVFAFTEEIDRWLTDRPEEAIAPAEVEPTSGPVETRTPGRHRPYTAVVVLAAVVSALAWWRDWPAASDELVARVSVTQDGLVAEGRTARLWTWPIPVQERRPSSFSAAVVEDGRAVMAGTVGDLATLVGSNDRVGGHLWRLSPQGTVDWAHTLDGHVERYNGREFGAPWVLRMWSADNRSGLIAAAWSHEVWWPSLTQVLDRDRRVLATFRNPGWVGSVAWLEDPAGRLVVGGVSNPHDAAMTALLDIEEPALQAPPHSGEFGCDDCGDGRPLRYLVLPRSEVNRTLAAAVNQALVESRHEQVTIRTIEVDRGDAYMGGEVVYELDRDLQLRTVTFSDRYWQVHARLEREGRLTHTRAECPERDGPRGIREWTPASGWRTLR